MLFYLKTIDSLFNNVQQRENNGLRQHVKIQKNQDGAHLGSF